MDAEQRRLVFRPACSMSVVVPAYNEEARLGPTLEAILAYFDRRGREGEILVVDDGSRDRPAEIAARAAARDPRVKLLGYGRNRGKGFAVRTGMLAASGERALFTDADLSTPIEDVERLEEALERGCDGAIGSRRCPGARILGAQPPARRLMGRVFRGIVSLTAVRGYWDTQCGFKLFRRDAARRIFGKLSTPGFAFDVEVLLRARREGLRIAEVPVRWTDSPVSRVRPVRDSLRMLSEVLRLKRKVR
jgi:dolichyl-phosphate beta-glucosyltransferase